MEAFDMVNQSNRGNQFKFWVFELREILREIKTIYFHIKNIIYNQTIQFFFYYGGVRHGKSE
jgi:hypothetical protein